MPMPSIFKYFLTVGCALLGVLFLANYLLEQPAPASAQNAAPAQAIVVKTDPQASRVERWRAEQAAADAARKEEAARLASQAAEPETIAPAAKPAKAAAAPASTNRQTADVSLNGTDAQAAPEQVKPAARKVRAEKAHGKRLARDEAKRERSASNQQDDYYYGQRQGSAQQGFGRPNYGPAPAYAYAPQPQQSFGPFGGGGWGGRGW